MCGFRITAYLAAFLGNFSVILVGLWQKKIVSPCRDETGNLVPPINGFLL